MEIFSWPKSCNVVSPPVIGRLLHVADVQRHASIMHRTASVFCFVLFFRVCHQRTIPNTVWKTIKFWKKWWFLLCFGCCILWHYFVSPSSLSWFRLIVEVSRRPKLSDLSDMCPLISAHTKKKRRTVGLYPYWLRETCGFELFFAVTRPFESVRKEKRLLNARMSVTHSKIAL